MPLPGRRVGGDGEGGRGGREAGRGEGEGGGDGEGRGASGGVHAAGLGRGRAGGGGVQGMACARAVRVSPTERISAWATTASAPTAMAVRATSAVITTVAPAIRATSTAATAEPFPARVRAPLLRRRVRRFAIPVPTPTL